MAVCRVCLCMHVRCICSPLLCSLMGRSSYTEYLELKKEKNAELFSYFDAIICGVRWVAGVECACTGRLPAYWRHRTIQK